MPRAPAPASRARAPRGTAPRSGRSRRRRAAPGARSSAARPQTACASTPSISATRRSSDRISESVTTDLPSRVIRADVDSIERIEPALQVLLRPCELTGPKVSRSDVGDLLGGDLERLDEVVLARAHVDPDLAGVGVLRERSCRRRRPSPASRGSPGRAARRRSRRGSRRGSRRRTAAGPSARRPGRRGRRGTARCPCAGSGDPAWAPSRAAAGSAACPAPPALRRSIEACTSSTRRS